MRGEMTMTIIGDIVITSMGLVLWCIFMSYIWYRFAPYIKVKDGEVMIKERHGRFQSVLKSGSHLMIPFVDTLKTVYWSYNSYDSAIKKNRLIEIETCRLPTSTNTLHLAFIECQTKEKETVYCRPTLKFTLKDIVKVVYSNDNIYNSLQDRINEKIRTIVRQLPVESLSENDITEKVGIFITKETEMIGGVECLIEEIHYPKYIIENRLRLEEEKMEKEKREKENEVKSESLKREREEKLDRLSNTILLLRNSGFKDEEISRMISIQA